MNSSEMDKIRAARLYLIREHVFFGSIAMQLNLVENVTLPFAAATNGKEIIFNPEMVKPWSFAETVFAVMHEVLHVVLLHHLRRGNRDPKKWNYAGDYVINWMIKNEHGNNSKIKLLPDCLLDSKYAGNNTEEVYNMLPDTDSEDGQNGEGQRGFDEVQDATGGMSESQIMAEEARVKTMIQNAAALARKAGQMTGGLELLVEATCNPKADWRAIVRDYLTQKAAIDYNWAVPNRRMMQQFGVLYPTLDGEKLGKVVVLVDASGSCYDDQVQFCAEVSDILSAYECSLDMIYHDTKVTHLDHYESEDLPIVLRPKGFGGTCPVSAFEEAVDLNPDVIIHLTDMEMDYSRVQIPSCDVLIATTNRNETGPKWATVIDIS